MAKTAAQIWSETHAASILHYFREMGSSHLVDDTCGLHSVKLEQKTLQGYLRWPLPLASPQSLNGWTAERSKATRERWRSWQS